MCRAGIWLHGRGFFVAAEGDLAFVAGIHRPTLCSDYSGMIGLAEPV